MAEIPIAHQIEYLQKEINKTRNALEHSKEALTINWLSESLATLEAILETVENMGLARCSICKEPQSQQSTFFCAQCIPFNDN
jgi:hypothetical protein